MALNLEKQLRFYGAYHHNPVNIAIHVTCVPVLLFTGIMLATNSPNLIPLPQKYVVPNLPPTLGLIACVAYGGLYILLEPVAGSVLAALVLAGTAYGSYLRTTYGATANYWAAGVHIACWIAQFIGHGVFEGRSPALFDNLVQAIFLAPLFVWLEVLFSLGYRPELKSRLDKFIEKDLAKLEQAKNQNGGQSHGVRQLPMGTPSKTR